MRPQLSAQRGLGVHSAVECRALAVLRLDSRGGPSARDDLAGAALLVGIAGRALAESAQPPQGEPHLAHVVALAPLPPPMPALLLGENQSPSVGALRIFRPRSDFPSPLTPVRCNSNSPWWAILLICIRLLCCFPYFVYLHTSLVDFFQMWPKSAQRWPNTANAGRLRAESRLPERLFGDFWTSARPLLDNFGARRPKLASVS